MSITHSLDDLKRYHEEAIQFFGSELILLKEVIPKITDERLTKAGILLVSCGQTGTALLHLSNQVEQFISEPVMLARAFMEKITNFCYLGICDDEEFRAFVLHPIYKHYHNVTAPKMGDDIDTYMEKKAEREVEQERLRQIPLVQEALSIFSETNHRRNWTKKTLDQRIDAIEKWGKLMDFFFRLNKIRYYSDASEALHGSMYGCTYSLGMFQPDFENREKEELDKMLYKEKTCILLHLGMLIHESFTLIKYSSDIGKIWDYSYKNRGRALNLLLHVLERKINIKQGLRGTSCPDKGKMPQRKLNI